MSAYLVSDKHINAIVSYANCMMRQSKLFIRKKAHEVDPIQPDETPTDHYAKYYFVFDFSKIADCQKAAQILLDENYRSLNARYKDPNQPHAIKFKSELKLALDYVLIIKACHCYCYQACESDDWEETLAKRIVDAIKENATRKVLAVQGYEEKPWGID